MIEKNQADEERASREALAVTQISIAVLPSKITSPEKSSGAFLDLSDPVITDLSLIRQLIVRPTTASRVFNTPYDSASVGFALGVDYVVESFVRREGARIRAAVQLVRVLDGDSLWVGEYDSDVRDIAIVESSISEQVVRTLNLWTSDGWARSTGRRIDDLDAYQKFKIGRVFFTEARFDKAIKSFKDVLKIDKNYAPALAGLADCHLWMGIYNAYSPQKTFDEAKKWANLALEKDDDLADAHAALAYTRMFERNWLDAETGFNLSIQLNHNCATAHQGYAHLLTSLRRFPEASDEIEWALEIDPFSPIINLVKGFVLYYSGRYNESLEQFQYTVSLNRRSHAGYYSLALACMQEERFKEALEAIHKAKRYSHNNGQKRGEEAYLLAMLGEKDKAHQVLDDLNEGRPHSYVPPLHIAAIYARLDEPDRAFQLLEDAFASKDQWMVLLRDDPRFVNLREDPRYADLVERLQFPPVTKTIDSK